MARPPLLGQKVDYLGNANQLPTEKVVVSPPAKNRTASPLIYVYQTTVTF